MAAISGAGWLLLLAATIDDRPLSEAVADGSAWVVLTQTRFGIRLATALSAGGFACRKRAAQAYRCARVGATCWRRWVGSPLWRRSLGRGMVGLPPETAAMSISPQIFFISAAASQLGSAGSSRLCCCSDCYDIRDEPGWAMIAGTATRRFSNLGIMAVGTLLVSGMINAWFLVGRTVNLTSTDYGRLLGLKIALFVGMVGVAAANRLHLMPQLSALLKLVPGLDVGDSQTARTECSYRIIIGLVIICIVGVLGVTPPATEAHIHVH